MARRLAVHGLALLLGVALLALAGGVSVAAAAGEPAGYEYFHTYAENEALIDSLVAAHPNIAAKFSIGNSYEGRDIWGIELTSNVGGSTKGKPEVFINALMHARERASNELALYMMQVLANNYGLSGNLGKSVTKILNSTVVWIVPMMNPDGAEYDFSGSTPKKWRKNRQPIPNSSQIGVDLNRQFGYTWNCCGGKTSTKPSSEYYQGWAAEVAPEVQDYENFVESRETANGKSKITEILSLHSAAKEDLWPYSYTKTDVPHDMTQDDHAAFVALGKGLAKRNGYKPMQGSDLYVVSGDQDDWAYGEHGIFAVTIELPKGATHRYYPSQAEINKFNAQNRSAVLWYLEQAGCPYAAAGLGAKYCGGAADQQYYSQSVYDASAVQSQQTDCWCAVASTRALLSSIDPSTSVAQSDISAYMTAHDKNDWTDPSFSGYIQCARGSPSPSYAHDGRGMAWALWNWATPDHSVGYNDYTSSNQATMDWRIVRGIRATNEPVGVMVVHGEHAILAVGYQTAIDPLNDAGQTNQLLGFRVWDPWYGTGFGNWSGWPKGGFAGNSFVTLADWNSKYFTSDQNEGPYFAGKYVAILQSSVAEAPNDSPAQNYGDWLYAQQTSPPTPTPTPTPSPTPTATPSPTDSPSPTPTPSAAPSTPPSDTSSDTSSVSLPKPAGTIAQAVADGLSTYSLLGDPELGNLPASYTVGTSVHVRSLAVGMPSYDLVELRVNGAVAAVALVDEVGGGYLFGELRPTTSNINLPTTSQLSSALQANGLSGTPSLSWTWTTSDTPPFAPFLTGMDAYGKTAFVTGSGVTEQLPLVNGITPLAN